MLWYDRPFQDVSFIVILFLFVMLLAQRGMVRFAFLLLYLKYAIFFLDATQFQIDPQALKFKKNMFGKPEVISFPSLIHVLFLLQFMYSLHVTLFSVSFSHVFMFI